MMKTTSVATLLLLLIFTISCQRNADFLKGDLVTYRHDLEIGTSATDLLKASKYKSLVVEIQYLSPGFTPDTSVVNHLRSLLQARLNKPEGISVITKQIQPSTQLFGLEQIKSIEETSRTEFTRGSRLAVYILYLNGYYAEDSLVLGTAYRNTSIAIFGKSINEYAAGDTLHRLLFDATVIEHEFGHLLGLVGQATPTVTDHQDLANGNHCKNRNCLMHHSFLDSGNDDQYLDGLASVPVMDSSCIADLQANGGR